MQSNSFRDNTNIGPLLLSHRSIQTLDPEMTATTSSSAFTNTNSNVVTPISKAAVASILHRSNKCAFAVYRSR